jgi:acetylornithine deacetylase
MSENDNQDLNQEMRTFVDRLLRFETVTAAPGAELEAQNWFRDQLDRMGFETYEWYADAEQLASHPTFPDSPDEFIVEDRPSVGGVLEFGDLDAGPTLLLNGHMDIVSATDQQWTSDPFEPVWGDNTLTARGAADMKSGLTACVFAARQVSETANDLDGRIVVESMAGEEDGGIGSAAAALSNPYPFDRDAAIIAEPTGLTATTAMEGTLFLKLEIEGQSAHAGSRWEGESVLPHFETIRTAFRELESRRSAEISNPLYDDYPISWPVNFGIVEAGSWPSSVPSTLTAKIRIGVAPSEGHAEVQEQFQAKLEEVIAESEWLSAHPPTLRRFAANFPSGQTDPEHPIVQSLSRAMIADGVADTDPAGAVYGADAARYIDMAGIPSVVFGPGSGEQAHNPDETIEWSEVLTAVDILSDVASECLKSES